MHILELRVPREFAGSDLGKDGVERTYDSFLRGTAGYKTVQVDAAGQPKGVTDETDPTPGNNLVLTIDANLEQAAENALAQGVQAAQTSGFANAAGGAVDRLVHHGAFDRGLDGPQLDAAVLGDSSDARSQAAAQRGQDDLHGRGATIF